MKYRLERIADGENEVIIRCTEMTQEIKQLLLYLQLPQRTLLGSKDGTQVVIELPEILYIESVEGKTFVYTTHDVLQVEYTLAQLEQLLNMVNFFRCSKSMILNIDKVAALKSLASNRIDATMKNGEHILISRTYAANFRRRLKGESSHE